MNRSYCNVVDLEPGTDGVYRARDDRRPARLRTRKPMPLALWLSGAAFGFVVAIVCGQAKAEIVDGRRIVLIDGDTVAVGSERIRILNIDTPETFRPRCEAELVAGLRAKERLASLLRRGSVTIDRQGQDRYRRTLARFSVNGKDVGEILIAEGHALPWRPGREAHAERLAHWCGSTR